MRSATRIGWVRHGITEWNQLGKIQGITDIPLSAEGIRQARLLANRLAREAGQWNGIYCSDLQRASQTAEILAERLGIPLIKDSRLRERSFGQAEGTTEAERLSRWGVEWRRLVPDQETDEIIKARGHEFVDELLEKHSGEAWLVVTHGSFLARMLQSLCTDLNDSHLLNMSLTLLEKQQEGWYPLLHNCTRHLTEETIKSSI
ncbi:histidine phosphatase family protein [Cohnella luojiensis]|uniref:Histidine phosphatase family protein n=1 Tax=Cohnella luojiensis TaxID=652876 RepID=A0A4Y8M9P9_9BACL|nr:histidine phosphatase family protein [Cohnella luojiensis]TFE30014.1 histidine phosphatase family protein [Cohnella luojiensis]